MGEGKGYTQATWVQVKGMWEDARADFAHRRRELILSAARYGVANVLEEVSGAFKNWK